MAFLADDVPLKQIKRADLDLDALVDGLRGNLRLLEAQLAKALGNTRDPMTPDAEALLRKKIARTRYQIWGASCHPHALHCIYFVICLLRARWVTQKVMQSQPL
jgi:hypothetical protein